jgi:ribonuclease HI
LEIISDSSLLVNAMEKGWVDNWRANGWKRSDKGNVENVDLWKELISTIGNKKVKFTWVKGHAGNPLNERCDELANLAAESGNLQVDEGFEKRF